MICCFSIAFGNAQHSFGSDIFAGKVLKHKESLLFDIPPLSSGVNFWYQNHTSGKKHWQRYWGKPTIEGLVTILDFGENDVLGRAFAIAPGIAFKLKKWGKSQLNLHYAPGIAYLTKPFNEISNPTNNAIGSHVNNLTRLKLGFEYALNDLWTLSLSSSFNHFSNGLTSSPNSGINVYAFNFGIKRQIKKADLSDDSIEPDLTDYRKWGLNFMYGLGVSEWSVSGGPNFPIYAYSFGGYWRFAPFQKLHFGAEYEFSHKVYEFELATFVDDDIARQRATRTVIYIADELLLGDFAARFQLGFYTPFANAYVGSSYYFKILTAYYPPFLKYKGIKPYVGMQLKTHLARAEYISMNVGLDF